MKYFLAALSLLVSLLVGAQQPIPNAHAHNDYAHDRPLFDALEQGFTCIEIDVYLHKDRLVVTHDPIGLKNKPTIQELYLEPLKKRIDENGGTVYKDNSAVVILMIDFKSGADKTYNTLKEVLKDYEPYLTKYKNGVKTNGPIEILISGNKPYDLVFNEETSYVTLDVTMDVAQKYPDKPQISRVSNNYKHYFKWDGTGEMPQDELGKLKTYVETAHVQGRHCRFWAIPETPELWQTFLDAGVDWINTDKLEEFAQFYKGYQKK